MQWDFDKLQMTKVIDFIYELSFSLNVERVLFCFILQDALDNCFVNSILFIYYTKIDENQTILCHFFHPKYGLKMISWDSNQILPS